MSLRSDQGWRANAACLDVDTELFYPSAKREGQRMRYNEPLRDCAGCEVQAECLEFAYEMNDEWAVMGGMSPGQRAKTRGAWGRARRAAS